MMTKFVKQWVYMQVSGVMMSLATEHDYLVL